MLEVGRICMKIAGREAGKYCVVVKKMDESFVMITGPKELTSVRRRRCNVNHLEPLLDVVKIKSDAPDSDVLKAYQEASLTRKLVLEPGKAVSTPKGTRKAEPKKAEAVKVPKPPKPEKAAAEKAAPEKAKAKPKKARKTKPKKAEARKEKPVKKAKPAKKAAPKKAAPRKVIKKPAAKPKKAAKKAGKKK